MFSAHFQTFINLGLYAFARQSIKGLLSWRAGIFPLSFEGFNTDWFNYCFVFFLLISYGCASEYKGKKSLLSAWHLFDQRQTTNWALWFQPVSNIYRSSKEHIIFWDWVTFISNPTNSKRSNQTEGRRIFLHGFSSSIIVQNNWILSKSFKLLVPTRPEISLHYPGGKLVGKCRFWSTTPGLIALSSLRAINAIMHAFSNSQTKRSDTESITPSRSSRWSTIGRQQKQD